MTAFSLRPMAHRTGRHDRVGRAVRWAVQAGPGRPRGLTIAALLLVAASAVPLLAGSGGRSESALGSLSAGPAEATSAGAAAAPSAAAAAAFGSVTGATGLDPLDLIGKGVIVAALLYLTLRVLRWLQAGPALGAHQLEVLETRPLGPKASLHLVAVGERRLVVGLTPGGIVGIAELDAAELAAPAGGRDDGRDDAGADAPALRALVRDGWSGASPALASRAIAAIRRPRPGAGRPGGTR